MYRDIPITIQSYQVRVYSNETSEWIEKYNETVASTVLNYNATPLHPNYYYRINVSATAENNIINRDRPTNILLIQTEEEGKLPIMLL